jgi:hypothetical protein
LSADDAARITHRNAAELFRHPLPDEGWLTTVSGDRKRGEAGRSGSPPSD